ncbi:MAG: hypothetical protein R6W82_06800 [bacterium]
MNGRKPDLSRDRRSALLGAAALAAIWLIVVLFFRELVFGGRVFAASGDSVPALIFERWGRAMLDRGLFPLWNPFVFSGMPSFGSLQFTPGVYPVNWLLPLWRLLFFGAGGVNILFHHLLGGWFAYLLLRDLDLEPETALLGAVIFFFSPQEIALGPAAHGGKLYTIAYLPLLLLLTRRFLGRPGVGIGALLAAAVGVQLLALHMQIAYYGMMLMGLYWVVDAVQHRTQRDMGDHLVRGAGLAAAGLLGLALSAYLLWPVYEYSGYSIRGGGALGGGVSYEYATSWSFHPLETLTFLVPSWFGFGGRTYWGWMPFTDNPYYMGLVPLLLAAAALAVRRRERVVQLLGIAAGLALLVSFGKWLPILYGPLFNLLPYFAKFRVPAMILILVLLAVAVLAALGLQGLLRLGGAARERWVKRLWLAGIAFGVLFLIFLLGRGALESAYVEAASARIAGGRAAGTAAGTALAREAFGMFWSDLLRVCAFASISAFLLHLVLKERVPARAAVALIGVLVLADLWVVNARLVETQPRTERREVLGANPAARWLSRQPGPFRIFDAGAQVPGNYWMHHRIEDVQGYSPAKLRIYQELMDAGLGPQGVSPTILAMLNARYLVAPRALEAGGFRQVFQEDTWWVYEFEGALGPAWLVGEAQRARTDQGVLDALSRGAIDPGRTALTTGEVGRLDPAAADSGEVVLLEREIHTVRYRVSAPGPVLMVASEVYYPAGWVPEREGRPLPVHRVDHVLRGVRVDPSAAGGSVEVTFRFTPRSVRWGRTLSAGAVLLIVVLMGTGLWRRRRERGVVEGTVEGTGEPGGDA